MGRITITTQCICSEGGVELQCDELSQSSTHSTQYALHCKTTNDIDITLESNKGTQSDEARRKERSCFGQRTTSGCNGLVHKNHQASLPAWKERGYTFTAVDRLHVGERAAQEGCPLSGTVRHWYPTNIQRSHLGVLGLAYHCAAPTHSPIGPHMRYTPVCMTRLSLRRTGGTII